jgi:hypothetical protein
MTGNKKESISPTLGKFLRFGQNNEARSQTLQTPLRLEPGKKMSIPESLECMIKHVVPRIRSTREMYSPVMTGVVKSIGS